MSKDARRVGLLQPLAIRDFRVMWAGLTVSLIGDGIYLVALAWLVYDISNVPTALSIVSVAWSLPMVLFLMVGGVLTDRFERRKVMIASDLIRGAAVLGMGLLAVTGVVELWHLILLAVVYGTGQALFGPALGAIVPDLVPQDLLVQANSLDSFIRPLGERLAGPALGGLIISTIGGGEAGAALLVDAGTFAFSAAMLSLMRTRTVHADGTESSMLTEIKEGLSFVRAHVWLWGTLLSATLSLLFMWGPQEVLVPFLVKNKLGGDAADLGFIYAAGGVGAIISAFVMGQRKLPRRHITFMYVAWGTGILMLGLYSVLTEVWQAMVVEFVTFGMFTGGLIVWTTLMHTLVPGHLLGRVTSLDWMVSTALLPVSFAVTGPLSEVVGVETMFVISGTMGSLFTFAFLFIPGMRETERKSISDGSDAVL